VRASAPRPGETKLEIDRRRITARMAKLRKQISHMKTSRTPSGPARRAAHPGRGAGGYTNAGKSSLLNRLTDAGVLVENALFATLDPPCGAARPPTRVFTLADTVGFVRHLPHQLVEAFRSTLEEVADADLLLHVVDASDPDPEAQIRAVRECWPRSTPCGCRAARLQQDRRRRPGHAAAAAPAGPGRPVRLGPHRRGIDKLQRRRRPAAPPRRRRHGARAVRPRRSGGPDARAGEVLSTDHLAEGTLVNARVNSDLAATLQPFAAPAGVVS